MEFVLLQMHLTISAVMSSVEGGANRADYYIVEKRH